VAYHSILKQLVAGTQAAVEALAGTPLDLGSSPVMADEQELDIYWTASSAAIARCRQCSVLALNWSTSRR